MRRQDLPLIIVVPLGALATVVLALTLLVILQVAGPIFAQVSPGVTGPGGVTPDAISFNPALVMFGTIGLLSIPAALALKFLTGDDDRGRPRPPRSGGGPF
jgi:hypothetical protein